MIQASIFNATRLSYDKTIHYLRKIAECWASHKAESIRAVECINAFKEMVENMRPAREIWKLLIQIEPAASTHLQKNFVECLQRNDMLNYCITPPTVETDEERLVGENAFDFDVVVNPSRDEESCVFNNSWNEESFTKKIVLLSVMQHQQMVVVPICWEGSTVKLLAEFAALSNVVHDIPPLESKEMTAEILRRLQFYVNHKIDGHVTNYTTPYRGFYHHHMPNFNSVVADALATPNGAATRAISQEGTITEYDAFYLRPSSSKKTMVALQWPYRLDKMRVIDVENKVTGFDLTTVRAANKDIQGSHVGFDDEGMFIYPEADISSAAVAAIIKRQFGGPDGPTVDDDLRLSADQKVN